MNDRRRMSEARRAQIVLGSVVAATVIILAVAFGFPDKNTPFFGLLFGPATPTATALPPASATSTPVATSTPAPTNTVPPTLTPTQTMTPTPTNTGTPTPTATPHPPRCPSATTTLCIFPASQSVYLGQQVQVLISVTNAANLGAFQATVAYDPAILTFAGSAAGPFLGASGRGVVCAPQPPAGGLFSVACVTLGPVPPDGVSGDGDLFIITFNATAPGTSALKLSGVQITDPLANLLPAATQDGAVTVINATPTPCPGGPCPTSTPTATATPYIPPSGPTTIYLNPANVAGTIGQQFNLDVVISNAINLGSFSVTVQFSPNTVGVAGVTPGPFLASSGRTVFCTIPVVRPDSVSFSCASQGSGTPGASGTGVLGTLSLIVATTGAQPLHVSGTIADPLSNILLLFTNDGSITGLPGPTATATPCPGVCPTSSPTPTFTPTPTAVAYPVTCGSAATTVCVQPVAQNAQVGSTVDVGIVVANVTGLGGFQFTLSSDPAVLLPIGVELGAFLGSSGRTVLCAAPTAAGSTAALACGTLGGQPPAGASGTGVVATVHYRVVGAGTSALALSNTIVTDLVGTPLTAATTNGTLTGVLATPTPCPGGVCPTPTATPTATPTSTPAPLGCPGARTTALMCLLPSTQSVVNGSTFTVQVVADAVSNVAAYEFELAYNPALITGISAVNLSFLGSSGRTVVCVAPIIAPGSIRFGCATVGASPPGPTAPGILATVTLQATGIGSTALTFTRSTLSDPLANAYPVTATNGSVTIQ